MKNSEKLIVFGLAIVVCVTFVLVFYVENSSPVEYFLLGVFGGGISALCYLLGKFSERKVSDAVIDDLFSRLNRIVDDSSNKMRTSSHSGSYSLGYNMAMEEMRRFVRKEWRNFT